MYPTFVNGFLVRNPSKTTLTREGWVGGQQNVDNKASKCHRIGRKAQWNIWGQMGFVPTCL